MTNQGTIKSKAKILANKLNLSHFIHYLQNLVIFVNSAGIINEFNKTAEIFFAIKRNQVIGKKFTSFCKTHHLKFPSLPDFEQHKPQKFKTLVSNLSQYRSVEWKIIPNYDSAKKIKELIFLGVDINKDSHAYQNIKSFKRHLDAVIESIAGNHWWKDIKGRYIGCNNAVTKSVGFKTPEEIIGKTDFELPWNDAKKAAILVKNDQEVITGGKSLTFEETINTSDGKSLTFFVTKVPLRDEHDKIIGTIGTSIDITDQKKAQVQLKIAKEQAEQASKAKSDFIANISHDLRTPLSGILGAAELLHSQVSDNHKEMTQQIANASQVLLTMFDEIIDYIKTEAKSSEIQNTQFSITNIVNDIIALLKLATEQKKLKLKSKLDTSIPAYLMGDASRLHRIVLNLVSNAIKFTNKGFVAIEVALAKKSNKNVLLKIIIKDTGIGMPANKLDDIFTRFTRLNNAYQGNFKGAGLGLSIVKQFVEEMGGEIHVQSQLNKGSKFICVLPFKKSLLNEKVLRVKKTPTSQKNQVALSTTNIQLPVRFNLATTPNILLIEDHPLTQTVTKRNLESLNCKVDAANSGQEALTLFKKNNYQLVLTDIGLPDITGYQITKAIRQFEASRNNQSIPIVAATAHASTEEKLHFKNVGGNEILDKPLLIDTLSSILSTYLGTQKKPKNNSRPISSLKNNSIIDLELGAKLIRGDIKAAKKMLEVLILELPDDIKKITSAYQQCNFLKLKDLVHKLHGGACYCGTPALKDAAANLEKTIARSDKNLVKKHYDSLIQQMKAVLEEFKKLR